MQWIVPSEKSTRNTDVEGYVWHFITHLVANSTLRFSEYAELVLSLIFLRSADIAFESARRSLEEAAHSRNKDLTDDPNAYRAMGAYYLTPRVRFESILAQRDSPDTGRRVNEMARQIERQDADLDGVLPQTYDSLKPHLLGDTLRIVADIHPDSDFAKIFDFILLKFAEVETKKGSAWRTAPSIARLLVEITEPSRGCVYDPACGTGGFFLACAEFSSARNHNRRSQLSIYGTERMSATGRLCRLNLAIHGLGGNIQHGENANSYYDDPHHDTGKFDFVFADPPFNVDNVDRRTMANCERSIRFPFGVPRNKKGNYLWIQLCLSSLKERGRSAFTASLSACDAKHSEEAIRRDLIETKSVDVVIAVSPRILLPSTLAPTLWFLDRGKASSERSNKVLFLDATNIYRQVDRSNRDWTEAQISFLTNIVRLYRGQSPDLKRGGPSATAMIEEVFGKKPKYRDIPGLCRAASIDEIKENHWSLNPLRFVGSDPDAVVSPQQFHSCFISYSSRDQQFAERLYTDLRARKVNCWLASEDLKTGDRFQERIEESIRTYDKVLIVLSEASVESRWVEREVNAAMEREIREKSSVLFPIRIDDSVLDAPQPWAADIRRSRNITNFNEWNSHEAYSKSLNRILRDLRPSASDARSKD